MFTAMLVKKILSKIHRTFFRALLYAIFALIILCLLVDRGVSFYVRDKIFTNIDELPFVLMPLCLAHQNTPSAENRTFITIVA